MMRDNKFVNIALINLAIIALIGVIMRYKIAFDFPFLHQKNLQLAHSHFAFTAWVTYVLMSLMYEKLKKIKPVVNTNLYKFIQLNLFSAYGMLVSFAIQGYGIVSILLSVLSLVAFVGYGFLFIKESKGLQFEGKSWFIAAILFNFLSALGTFNLAYIMLSKHLDQHVYLSSVYWYLHFQYNGWFFFGCFGLLADKVHALFGIKNLFKQVFLLFAISCIPAYGLSILWLNLPFWIYMLVCVASITQIVALFLIFQKFRQIKFLTTVAKQHKIKKWLYLFVAIAVIVKFSLQLGSTVPAISKFAFGFRPIVIAYLHLVLLALISGYLILFLYVNNYFNSHKYLSKILLFFYSSILLNQLILAMQGLGSVSYTVVPFANEALLFIAIMLFVSISLLFYYGRARARNLNFN